MNAAQIENNLLDLVESLNNETFIYDFLLAYDTPKSNVKRLKDGALNLSTIEREILWKKKLLFKEALNSDTHLTIDALKTDPRVITHTPRFIIVTDFKTFLAIDTKNQDSLDISILDLAKNFDFFLPLAGMEKAQYKGESPADVKAAEKMAKLYDEIKKDNPTTTVQEVHGLNVFLSRLLFCFFAEDTEIFSKNQFTNAIKSHTQADGSDLQSYLERLFFVLNTDYPKRENLPQYLNAFPYVNGGLFREQYAIPVFTRKSLNAILECGDLNWKDINPDIFGSMIQAVITPEHRGGMGMHYTSVPNIMKVIEPLFVDDLKEEFEASKNQPKKLEKLLYRLSKLKIFDPACGSGNFLIIAYKELRMLEIEIIQHLEQHQRQLFSSIQLTQFYGIELDDFAHEIAILSLWLAQHQMNMKFREVLGQGNPTLPLKEGGHILHGNATRLEWELVCPKKDGDEIYILGNPPYLGAKELNNEQKKDMDQVFVDLGKVKRLDYIACWFKLASDFITGIQAKYAFVSTNSICQGEQVSLIWPYIFSKNQAIFFCHQSFNWENNARSNAGVTCVIIGVQGLNNESSTSHTIYDGNKRKKVKNISPYLIEGESVYAIQRTESISGLPKMILGSSGFDGGNLLLDVNEMNSLVGSCIESKKYIKRFMSGDDFLSDHKRFCLWIPDDQVSEAIEIPEIFKRVEECKKFREGAGRDARKAANVPHRFFYRTHKETTAIIFPKTTSGRREYVPIGFTSPNTIVSNAAFVIYDAELYVFAILSSKIHNVWMSITSAKMRTDFRYSVNLTYNTFPFPNVSQTQKQDLEKHVFHILEERESHSEKTLAQLYDPDKMPEGLREAHHQLDLAVERCYRSKPFDSDEERLQYLFRLYEKMVLESFIISL